MNPTYPSFTGHSAEMHSVLNVIALSTFFDCSPVAKFVIDCNHVVTHWNKACESITGVSAEEMIGTRHQWMPFYRVQRPMLADLVLEEADEEEIGRYYEQVWRSTLIPGAYECEAFFPGLGEHGKWLLFSAATLRDEDGCVVGAIEILQDVSRRKIAEQALRKTQVELERLIERRTAELAETNAKLSQAQAQLMQSEKLASIGQLAAGVAHEINNPIGYVFSNFGTLERYMGKLFDMLGAYERTEASIASGAERAGLQALKADLDIGFVKEDIPQLMNESKEGIARVRKIVQDLKDFSRVDTRQDWQWANLHQGIDSTLNIVTNEVKYKADVIKEYGDIPDVECVPSQINQVVMNMVINAAQAMKEERGRITIRTGREGDRVWIDVEDTGAGIPEENMARIFDPFFTTKPVGKGTGLGLSLAYGIIQKHRGSIDVRSEVGVGTCFHISLPIHQPVPTDRSKVDPE